MIKKVFVHIGSPKTGTSAIQSHLSQNREILKQRGILYPYSVSTDKTVYKTYDSHHLLMYSLAGWQPFKRFDPENFFHNVEKTANKYKLHTLILSAENLFWLPINLFSIDSDISEDQYWSKKRLYYQALFKFLDKYDTKVIVYLRRQDRWLESWYNQQIKNGNHLGDDFEAFSHSQRFLLDYETHLSILSEILGGNDSIIVRPYEQPQLNEGLFQNFLNALDLGSESNYLTNQKPKHNAQLSRDALEFMNWCNSLSLNPKLSYKLRGVVRKITNQLDSTLVYHDQSLLPPKIRIDIINRYKTCNDRINTLFVKNRHSLFLEEVPSIDDVWTPHNGLNTEEATKFLLQVILELSKEKNSLSPSKKVREILWKKYPIISRRFQNFLDNLYWKINS